MLSWKYKIALGIDLLALLLGVYLMIEDSTRSVGYSGNADSGLMLVTLLFAAWLFSSYLLYTRNQKTLATIMVWVPAVPILLYAFFILAFIILKPDMR